MMDVFTEQTYTARQKQLLGVCIFCLIISTLAVILRLLTRRLFDAKLWWDDYIVVLALIFSYMPNIFTIIDVTQGLGRHASEVSLPAFKVIGITLFVHELFWNLTFLLIIVTILMLYVRLFPNTWMRKTCYSFGIFNVLNLGAGGIALIFQCTPIRFFWDKSVAGGHCVRQYEFYVAGGAITMISVVIAFFLPIPIIWGLKITTSKKWALVVAFSVGGVACAASIVRLVVLAKTDARDLTWTIAYPLLWSCVEVSIGVASTCVPSLMPLVLLIAGKKQRSSNTQSQIYAKYPHDTSRSRQSKRFSRMDEDPATLPDGVELSTTSRIAIDDSDEERLVEGRKQPGGIVVTNQIVQEVSQQLPPEKAVSLLRGKHSANPIFTWQEPSPLNSTR